MIREASSSQFQAVLAAYLADVPGLQAQYDAARAMHRIPVTLPGGEALTLSPGGQNVLLKQIVENFCPYLGMTTRSGPTVMTSSGPTTRS